MCIYRLSTEGNWDSCYCSVWYCLPYHFISLFSFYTMRCFLVYAVFFLNYNRQKFVVCTFAPSALYAQQTLEVAVHRSVHCIEIVWLKAYRGLSAYICTLCACRRAQGQIRVQHAWYVHFVRHIVHRYVLRSVFSHRLITLFFWYCIYEA